MSRLHRFGLWRGFFVVALLLSMIGTAGARSTVPSPIVESDPGHDRRTPLTVAISLSETPSLHKTAEATIVVSSSQPANSVYVNIVGSDGLHIEGETSMVVDLRAGESRRWATKVTPEVAGNHSVAVNASLDLGGGNVWGDSDAVYFASGDGTASRNFVFAGDPTSGGASPGPGNTMEIKPETFPDGSMAAFTIDRDVEILVDSGTPGSPDESALRGDPAALNAELTIRGNTGMFDRKGVWQPQMLLVELLSDTGISIAWTYSDYDGNYVFRVDNPGAFRIRAWAYYRHTSMTVGAIRVVGSGLQTWNPFSIAGWNYSIPVMGPVPDGEFDVGGWVPGTEWGGNRAWWIYQDLIDAFRYTWDKVPPGVPAGSRQPDGVTVEWEPGSTDGTYYRGDERRVHLADVDANSGHTVLHEYGHAVMHNVYGGYFPVNDCPNPHYITSAGGNNCSWTEGWANFFSLAVKNDPVYTWGCARPCIPSSLNFEAHAPGDYWDEGEFVEGNVAATLWDFIDPYPDGLDKTTSAITPFWKIWDVVYNNNDDDFNDFWFTWHNDVNLTNSLATLYQNTIDWGWMHCADHIFEPDDSYMQLQVYSHPDDNPYQKVLCTDYDIDYYKFEAVAGRSYTIETLNLGTAQDGSIADTTLVLYGPSAQGLTTLAYDDNSGSQYLASRIIFTAAFDGWHYVGVRHAANRGDLNYRYSIDFTLNP